MKLNFRWVSSRYILNRLFKLLKPWQHKWLAYFPSHILPCLCPVRQLCASRPVCMSVSHLPLLLLLDCVIGRGVNWLLTTWTTGVLFRVQTGIFRFATSASRLVLEPPVPWGNAGAKNALVLTFTPICVKMAWCKERGRLYFLLHITSVHTSLCDRRSWKNPLKFNPLNAELIPIC